MATINRNHCDKLSRELFRSNGGHVCPLVGRFIVCIDGFCECRNYDIDPFQKLSELKERITKYRNFINEKMRKTKIYSERMFMIDYDLKKECGISKKYDETIEDMYNDVYEIDGIKSSLNGLMDLQKILLSEIY